MELTTDCHKGWKTERQADKFIENGGLPCDICGGNPAKPRFKAVE